MAAKQVDILDKYETTLRRIVHEETREMIRNWIKVNTLNSHSRAFISLVYDNVWKKLYDLIIR